MNSKKIGIYDCAKVIATLLVVLAHVTRMYTGEGVVTPSNSSPFLDILTDVIYSFHMQLFTAISGAVYCYSKYKKQKYKDTGAFIIGKARRFLIPYLAFGILYVAPVMVALHFTELGFFNYTFRGICLSLDSRHLWYLLMLFGVMLIFQFGYKYIEKYPVPAFVVFFLLSMGAGRFPALFQIGNVCKYCLYFYIGYCFEKKREQLKLPAWLCPLSLCLLLLLNYTQGVIGLKHYILRFLTALAGMLFIYVLGSILCRTEITETKLYQSLLRNSFGIYLFHPMIVYVLFYYTGGLDIPPILLSTAIFLIALVISSLLTDLLRLVKLHIVIGETR